MNGLGINRGFELMIPKKKQEVKDNSLFRQQIKFKLFKKEITFLLEVKGGE